MATFYLVVHLDGSSGIGGVLLVDGAGVVGVDRSVVGRVACCCCPREDVVDCCVLLLLLIIILPTTTTLVVVIFIVPLNE